MDRVYTAGVDYGEVEATDEEEEEEEEEEDGSGGSGVRSVFIVDVGSEADLNGGISGGVVRRCPYVGVRELVLPPQPQHPLETAEVEMIETSSLGLVHRPDLRFVQQRREDDGFVHL
nr:unnamed protein product [Spirometra erinaceieuropaei]